ncbi:hypothetical protein OVA03_05395 [Asticcacaulis sp. SL142]|uniref:hypothetical protein n=1 Tax=Asticcacaulis sp. SL142 TaxID=2995155 RepID=UPI00226CD0A2|nr:hypothetical protein [Asticcacaulis sp. SL142]WAC49344.1 hypothetical protein OVA03_05395 [Asticcacaulis sp. SL142]
MPLTVGRMNAAPIPQLVICGGASGWMTTPVYEGFQIEGAIRKSSDDMPTHEDFIRANCAMEVPVEVMSQLA